MKELVFIHGAGNDKRVWNSVKKMLSDKYSVHAPNLPGHLGEEGFCNSIECYAEWILSYIDKNNLKDTVLIGHSMGGAVAVAATANNSGISGLIVVDSGLRLPVNLKILDGLKNDFETTTKMITRWLFSKDVSSKLKEAAFDMMLDNRSVLLSDFEACNVYDGYIYTKNIDKPSLVIVGEFDVMTPINLARDAAENLQADVVTISNAGHMVQLENPEGFVHAIEQFLNS